MPSYMYVRVSDIKEMGRLNRFLNDANVNTLTIVATGGFGKTQLVKRIFYEQVQDGFFISFVGWTL